MIATETSMHARVKCKTGSAGTNPPWFCLISGCTTGRTQRAGRAAQSRLWGEFQQVMHTEPWDHLSSGHIALHESDGAKIWYAW